MSVKIKAVRRYMEIYDPKKRSRNDKRTFVTWAVFSYFTESGIEYRRSCEAPINTPESDMWNLLPNEIIVNN